MKPAVVPILTLMAVAVLTVMVAFHQPDRRGGAAKRRVAAPVPVSAPAGVREPSKVQPVAPSGSLMPFGVSKQEDAGLSAAELTILPDLLDGGRIQRLPVKAGDGELKRFFIHPEAVSGLAPGDGLEIGLGFDGPIALTRLADFPPRQQNAPVAMDGVYYSVEVSGSGVVFWGQTGKPENVSLDHFNDTPLPASYRQDLALAQLATQGQAPIRIPQLVKESTVKVWYTIFSDDPIKGLGAPAYQFTVPASVLVPKVSSL